jgi:hypothetical protein
MISLKKKISLRYNQKSKKFINIVKLNMLKILSRKLKLTKKIHKVFIKIQDHLLLKMTFQFTITISKTLIIQSYSHMNLH